MIRPLASLSIFAALLGLLPAQQPTLTLRELVDPSSIFRNQDGAVPVFLHAFIEFRNLENLFDYIDTQAGRWRFESPSDRKSFADSLLRRGIESRIISMTYEKPREILLTHTRGELAAAVDRVPTKSAPLIYQGKHWQLDRALYREMLLDLQRRWRSSLNCWSASPSIAGRVLSNWYIIEEGIDLFNARYDSTEHFWQAVKYHPRVRLKDLLEVLGQVAAVPWEPWIEQLANDQKIHFEHGYAVEFLRKNLSPRQLQWFAAEIEKQSRRFNLPVRELQQRDPALPWKLRYTPPQEKILWGDLADVFHLLFFFARLDEGRLRFAEMNPVLDSLSRYRFDGIYLSGYGSGRMDFVSPEFRQLMLEIWKVKFLKMQRFREVLRSTRGLRLLHFLNDGDSPDIPIPVYVGFLDEIREMALR